MNFMLKGVVYCFTNKENDMKYVGRTLRPSIRFMQHLNANISKHNTYDYFHKAIREIGCQGDLDEFMKHFDFQVLETLYYDKDTKEEVNDKLNELESLYINKLDTLWPNGYNYQSFSSVKCFHLTKEQVQKAKENQPLKRSPKDKTRILVTKLFFTNEQDIENKTNNYKQGQQNYWNSPEGQAKLAATKERQEQRNKELKEKRELEKAEYWNSPEGQARRAANIEKVRATITAYNQSDVHRKAAIESNKRRWANGCPEETRKKMSESNKGRYKGKHWKIDQETNKRVWY